MFLKLNILIIIVMLSLFTLSSCKSSNKIDDQKSNYVSLVENDSLNKLDIFLNGKYFTSYLYKDSILSKIKKPETKIQKIRERLLKAREANKKKRTIKKKIKRERVKTEIIKPKVKEERKVKKIKSVSQLLEENRLNGFDKR